MFPSLPHVLEQQIVSMVEMLPGIRETAEVKQQLFDDMKPMGGSNKERCLARKELPGGRICFVRMNGWKSTKRPRGGEPTRTYSCCFCHLELSILMARRAGLRRVTPDKLNLMHPVIG